MAGHGACTRRIHLFSNNFERLESVSLPCDQTSNEEITEAFLSEKVVIFAFCLYFTFTDVLTTFMNPCECRQVLELRIL